MLTKYNLSAQKDAKKVKYIQEYFDKYQHRLSLDQIKGQFVEETEDCKDIPLDEGFDDWLWFDLFVNHFDSSLDIWLLTVYN